MLIFWTFYSSKNPEKIYHSFHKNIKQLFLNCANQYIRMISGSCDTEDWSNDAEHSALITRINYILKYIQIENKFIQIREKELKWKSSWNKISEWYYISWYTHIHIYI